jgi:hypothetical protein
MVVAKGDTITESHLVHVIAFDAAGNETESEKVRFYVIHKPKEEEKEVEDESGAIWRRDEGMAALPWVRGVSLMRAWPGSQDLGQLGRAAAWPPNHLASARQRYGRGTATWT